MAPPGFSRLAPHLVTAKTMTTIFQRTPCNLKLSATIRSLRDRATICTFIPPFARFVHLHEVTSGHSVKIFFSTHATKRVVSNSMVSLSFSLRPHLAPITQDDTRCLRRRNLAVHRQGRRHLRRGAETVFLRQATQAEIGAFSTSECGLSANMKQRV